jgi:hypothetical protein
LTASNDTTDRNRHPIPLGLRVAALLCALAGVMALSSAVMIARDQWRIIPEARVGMAVDLLASSGVCAAAILAWRRRKSAISLLVAGWALPAVAALAVGDRPQLPGLLLALALIALLGYRHELRVMPGIVTTTMGNERRMHRGRNAVIAALLAAALTVYLMTDPWRIASGFGAFVGLPVVFGVLLASAPFGGLDKASHVPLTILATLLNAVLWGAAAWFLTWWLRKK